MTAVFCMFQIK